MSKKVWIKWIRRTESDGRSRWAKRDEEKRKNRKIEDTDVSKEGWTEKNGGRNRDLRETGEKRETGQIGEV